MGAHTVHCCSACGYQSRKWLGRCPECGTWGGLEPRVESGGSRTVGKPIEVLRFAEIESEALTRTPTGSEELDRVLGGGLVPGAAILIGGEPGIGKSTLALQAAGALARRERRVLYVSGEESATQLRERGKRLAAGSDEFFVVADSRIDSLLEIAGELRPELMIVDSIQAVRCGDLDAVPGSVSQVRECAARLVTHAKSTGVSVLLVGHVTKEGSIAGPRLLEHVVDAVLQFEGDRHHEHRVLRALKNRFGPVGEIGVFRMTERGLIEVPDPSDLLLSGRAPDSPGSIVMPAMQGSRPLLIEIQALVGEPSPAPPRRTTVGFDSGRLALILAVLQRRTGIDLARRDVFVNVTGGVPVDEPAADLAVASAVASSAHGRPTPARSVVFGEIGLTGEVRAVPRTAARIAEAARLGFDRAIVPRRGEEIPATTGLRIDRIAHVGQALDHQFEDSRG